MFESYEFAMHHRLANSSLCPYEQGNNCSCSYLNDHGLVMVTSFVNVSGVHNVKSALYHAGPLASAIAINDPGFEYYSSGS